MEYPVKDRCHLKKESICPRCGFRTEESVCPVCRAKLRGVESIPLESTGLTGKNARLLIVLTAVVLLLLITAAVLVGSGKKNETGASSELAESETVSATVSETVFPKSIMDEETNG